LVEYLQTLRLADTNKWLGNMTTKVCVNKGEKTKGMQRILLENEVRRKMGRG